MSLDRLPLVTAAIFLMALMITTAIYLLLDIVRARRDTNVWVSHALRTNRAKEWRFWGLLGK